MLWRISRVLRRRLDCVAAVVDSWQAARDARQEQRRARELFQGLLLGGLRSWHRPRDGADDAPLS